MPTESDRTPTFPSLQLSIMRQSNKPKFFHAFSGQHQSWMWTSCSKRVFLKRWNYKTPSKPKPLQLAKPNIHPEGSTGLMLMLAILYCRNSSKPGPRPARKATLRPGSCSYSACQPHRGVAQNCLCCVLLWVYVVGLCKGCTMVI